LYGGMSVGADAMQRRASIPSSLTFILQSLTVLLVLAFDALRYYKINFSALSNRTPPPVAEEASK
jgi:simple sugar transport system permease protein